ncbi:MAG: ABC transporter substrate-binding protein [Gemmatimonadaceae bacterium]
MISELHTWARRARGAAAIAAALATVGACGGGRDGRPLRIGAPGPWSSGSNATQRHGIELAVAEINAGGGVRGRPLEAVFPDDGADAARAVGIAGDLIDDASVVAVVGHVNSGTLLAAARLYDGRLPAVAATATSPDVSGVSRWVFRVVPSDSLAGASLARAAAALGGRRAAVLYENDSYGRGLARAFAAEFRGTLVSIDPVSRSTRDYEPYVAYYRRQAPDVVFVASSEETGLRFLRAARQGRLHSALLAADGWLGVTVDTAAAEGAYVGVAFVPTDPSPAAQRFVAAFHARYGADPDASAALAYDATRLVARALTDGGPSRGAVRDYLATVGRSHSFEGVTGTVRFDASGDPAGKDVLLTRVHDGALRVVDAGAATARADAGSQARPGH